MARIRTIKPEFPQSETIGRLSRDARLLFVQLWTIVDDDGRARAASRMLASLLYPYDDDAKDLIGGWLSELDSHGLIRRYEVDGSHYLEVVGWCEHQKIDRPTKSRLPAFEDGSRVVENDRESKKHIASPREPSRGLDTDLGPRTLDLVSGSGPSALESATSQPDDKKSRKRPRTTIPDDYKFSATVREYGRSLGFTDAELDREEQRFIRHAKQNDRKQSDWDLTAESWLDKGAEFAGKAPPVDRGKAAAALNSMFYAEADSPQIMAWDEYSKARRGQAHARDKKGGWYFPTEWPPGYSPGEAKDIPRIEAPAFEMRGM